MLLFHLSFDACDGVLCVDHLSCRHLAAQWNVWTPQRTNNNGLSMDGLGIGWMYELGNVSGICDVDVYEVLSTFESVYYLAPLLSGAPAWSTWEM